MLCGNLLTQLHTKKKWFKSYEFCYPQAPHLFERNNFCSFQLSFELKETKIILFKQTQRLRVAKQIFVYFESFFSGQLRMVFLNVYQQFLKSLLLEWPNSHTLNTYVPKIDCEFVLF